MQAQLQQQPQIEQRLRATREALQQRPGFLREATAEAAAAALGAKLQDAVAMASPGNRSCTISNRTPLTDNRDAEFVRVAMQVRLRCGVAELATVLHSLETGSPRLFVDNLNLIAQRTSSRRMNPGSAWTCRSNWPVTCCPVPLPMTLRRHLQPSRARRRNRLRLHRHLHRLRRKRGRRWPMKLEQISLRTGFLLALAGWAAAVWLATGFGLGSQLPAAGGNADAVPSLPVLPPLAAERMPSADSYSAISERPLFAEDRRPKPYLLGGSEPAASAALRLTGVLLTGNFGMATFTTEQNRSLRLRLNGEAVDGWQLVALQPRQATVIGPGGNQVLELAVFNGQGGEPPTVLRGANVCRRQVRSLCRPRQCSAGTAAGCGNPIAVACWQCASALGCGIRPCHQQRPQRSADAGHPRTHPGPSPPAAATTTAATTVAAPGDGTNR